MLELAERLTASLKDINTYPWFPHLTDELASANWRALERSVGLTTLNYGTARILTANANGPRDVVTSLRTNIGAGNYKDTIPVELLPREITRLHEVTDVNFCTAEEIAGTNVLSCLEGALGILGQVPSLITTVAALVRSLHVIKPESADYDVSFTDPQIPFSIFVSVPQECTHINHLRIAEAIVHEAMHLQLTFIEKLVPLIVNSTGMYFSPWKQEYRTPQGVLHSLYVFRVIDRLLEMTLSLRRCLKEEMSYIGERRVQIAEEMSQVKTFLDCPDLTPIGHGFVLRLYLTHK
jgi:HEXXH motif-containing protein